MKRKLIPDVPENSKVPEKIKKKLEAWISYFKNLSSRIKVVTPADKDFDFKKLETACKFIIDSNKENHEFVVIKDWPEERQIAFCVCYDSSLPGHKPEFLNENVKVFCFKDFAFGLDYFSSPGDGKDEYELEYFPESALTWNYIAKRIKDCIVDIEKSVPNLPKKQK